jgi:hypothetical protein
MSVICACADLIDGCMPQPRSMTQRCSIPRISIERSMFIGAAMWVLRLPWLIVSSRSSTAIIGDFFGTPLKTQRTSGSLETPSFLGKTINKSASMYQRTEPMEFGRMTNRAHAPLSVLLGTRPLTLISRPSRFQPPYPRSQNRIKLYTEPSE